MKAPWRGGLTLAGLVIGLLLGYYLFKALGSAVHLDIYQEIGAALLLGALGGFVGFFSATGLQRGVARLNTFMERRVLRASANELLFGGVGMLLGFFAAFLLTTPLNAIPVVGNILPIVFAVFFGYVGAYIGVGVARKRESRESEAPARGRLGRPGHGKTMPKVLDTSVIIDGRIADILETGFIEGPIVVPQFVLDELRHIADSADVLKRNRGRRGLDVLNHIQKELQVPVQISDKDYPNMEVDSKLLRLTKQLEGKVLTNDFNLNKVAVLQQVPVLNINELANAVKPVVLPGEEMVVHIIKEGKEIGQGVAYLDDGTMIVVDGGKKYIGETLAVLVTSVLQTSAGRMIFAKPKSLGDRQEQNGNRLQAQP